MAAAFLRFGMRDSYVPIAVGLRGEYCPEMHLLKWLESESGDVLTDSWS